MTLGINIHLATSLPKKRNNFTTAKQILFFIDSPFRPMLNILSHFIFQQATGDVSTLQPSILKSTPVNKNLTGFSPALLLCFRFGDRPSFRAKDARGVKLQFFPSLGRSTLISCARCPGGGKIAYCPDLDDRPSFRAKGCFRKSKIAIVFGDRPSFCAKGSLPHKLNRFSSSLFDDRASLRAKGLTFRVCTQAPPGA